jgi:predicted transposase YdaD
METDKQLYRVFAAQPQWVFELAGLPPVGKCAMRSLTVKTLERRTDGVIVPEDAAPPLSVIEFQFGENSQIYTRTVQKMAAVQEEFGMREVQGVIFFGDQRFDPRTKPWTSLVRAIDLPAELRRLAERSPNHPLVAAFQPLLAESEAELQRSAVGFLHTIKTSKLRVGVKEALEEVFMSWLGQRLPHRTKQEIEEMLVGELPELLETRMAQDILKIGKAEGLAEAVFILLGAKRGRLTKAIRQRIQKLTNDQLCELLAEAHAWESLDPLAPWLAKHGR